VSGAGSDTTTTVASSGLASPVHQSINQSESSLSESTTTLCNAISVESVTASSSETLVPASSKEALASDIDNQQVEPPTTDWADEPWYEEVGAESWCQEAAWCEDLEQSWSVDPPEVEELVPSTGSKGMARNFNYDVIVDFVKQAWESISYELSTTTSTCAPVIYYHHI